MLSYITERAVIVSESKGKLSRLTLKDVDLEETFKEIACLMKVLSM